MANTPNKTASKKPKLVRDSFTIPKAEYQVIEDMKARAISLGTSVKKSELLRAGLKLLQSLSDSTYKAALAAVPALKTGRPATEVPAPDAVRAVKTVGKAAGRKTMATAATKAPVKAAVKAPVKAAVKSTAKGAAKPAAKSIIKPAVKAAAKAPAKSLAQKAPSSPAAKRAAPAKTQPVAKKTGTTAPVPTKVTKTVPLKNLAAKPVPTVATESVVQATTAEAAAKA